MNSIAIFGGTFDPIHQGHVQTSLSIQSNFNFDSYYFLPCKIPVLKSAAYANNQQRIDMIELVIKNHPEFKVDLREIKRDSPSYMVETLTSFREENKEASLTLILGYDAFLTLPQWHHWKEIIKLSNLLIINRNQFSSVSMPEEIKELLMHHTTELKTDILSKKAGFIYLYDAGNYEISSTHIREALKKNKQMSEQVPEEVAQYIKQWALYQ